MFPCRQKRVSLQTILSGYKFEIIIIIINKFNESNSVIGCEPLTNKLMKCMEWWQKCMIW